MRGFSFSFLGSQGIILDLYNPFSCQFETALSNIDGVLSFSVLLAAQELSLSRFRFKNCLIYKAVVPSPSLIQVGTFLAPGYLEEVMSMTDSQFPASNRTIKVIDDERELVAVVRTMLEEKGFNVTCAYIGLELFASLKEQKPDLILLDIMMPQMGGLEELTRFKEDPSIPFIPVILLTEKADDEDVMVGYKRGADFYITKPFTKDQLLDGFNSILS